ncbi:MAG: hypothetical protein LiPW30_703 [Parcubacteria group bacterium LiPW_30]|nr:MAG: hypothetical protein LiPW30_703 [Parcubacteria group bacterium LiPW_30]
MGHIRLGRLPKKKPWSAVFSVLKGENITPSDVARTVVQSAKEQFSVLEGNAGVNYCFWILVRIATAARSNNFFTELEQLGINIAGVNSGVAFVQHVSKSVEQEVKKRVPSTVFVRMAELSLREVLSSNIIEQSKSLFGTGGEEICCACRAISTRNSFGKVAREFFSKFISRSIRYIADKELSNYIGSGCLMKSPREALAFHQELNTYCFNTAKIVEEFSAGWFSKHNWETNNNISEESTVGFTAYALQKIQMELEEQS